MSKDNTILYFVGEIPIRKKNSVRLSLNEPEYRKIAEVANKTGLPIAFILAMQGQTCKCGNDLITVDIPKNLLSVKKPNNGRSITNRLIHDKQE